MPNGFNESTINDGFSIFYHPSWAGPVGDVANGMNRYSSQNPAMIARNSLTYFLTIAESELLLAEAAQRWGSAFGTAKAHYDAGVTAAMASLSQFNASMTVTPSDISAYLASNPFVPANALEMINTQYWAETGASLNFIEGWFNWRRSGYPVLVPVKYPGNITGGTVPRRYTYPVGEAATNAENLSAAQAALAGGDKWTSRMWWDK